MLNKQGKVYKYNGKSFLERPGIEAKDIAVGADGSVWAVGLPKNAYGFTIYKSDATVRAWTKVAGSAVRITVDRNGMPWVINGQTKIFRFLPNQTWQMVEGKGYDIGAGPDGSIFSVGIKKGTIGKGY